MCKITEKHHTQHMIVNIISTLSPEQALPSSTTSDLIGPVNYNFSYDNFNRLTSASGSYTGPNDVVNTQSQGGNPFLKHEYNLDLTYDAQDPSRNFINKTQTHLNKPVSDLNEPMENASVVKNNSYQLDYTYDDDGGLIAGSNYGYTQPHAVREIKEQPTGVNCCGSQDDPRIKNQNIKHDANGNLTKVIEGVGEEEITKIHYLWDEENRLMAADLNPYSEESDHPIATYTYDAGGERIIKYLYQQVDIHSNAKDVGNARKTETYIYPDGMITAKVLKFIVRDQALSYTKHYHIGSQRVASKIGTSERFGFYSEQIIPLANLANADGINLIDVLQDPDEDGQNFNHLNERRNRILQAFDIPPLESETDDISEDENVTTGSNNFAHGFAGDLQHVEVFYFHSDHLGSSNYMSNYDGDISQHAEYLPFGELLTDEHLNSHNTRYKYNGKEFDQETGNYYYGARYFNPKTSLWLSVDPMAEKFPGWSPYAYAMHRPTVLVDPTGMSAESPDDWVYDKQNDKYVWKEEVNEAADITNTNRYEYVGESKGDINQHFDKNLSNFDRFKRAIGGSVRPNVDEGSYISAKVTPKLEEAIHKQRTANQRFSESDPNDDYASMSIYPAIDLNIEGYSRKSGILSSNTYSFKSTLNIDGENIPFTGNYTVRNKNANYINQVDATQNSFATPFGQLYSNPVIFSGKGPTVIINLGNKSAQKRIDNFMWDF
jgi:RHS repeat-associated protein